MFKSSSIKEENQPYLTKLEDQNGNSIIVNSSSMKTDSTSPSMLLEAALCGCMTMTIKGSLMRAGHSFDDVNMTVAMKNEDGKITFTYHVDVVSDEDPAKIEEVKNAAALKCYVRNILGGQVSFEEV